MALHHVFYTFQGSPRFLPIDAVTSEEALAAAARLHPQIKTLSHAEPVPDKVPTWLQVEELHWDESVVAFLAHLATHSTVFSDAPEWATRACENKFFELSKGEVFVWPSPPAGSVADAERYGARAIISFSTSTPVPTSLTAIAHNGKIQRMSFFWALIGLGFVPGKTQTIARISVCIPAPWRACFNECVQSEVAH